MRIPANGLYAPLHFGSVPEPAAAQTSLKAATPLRSPDADLLQIYFGSQPTQPEAAEPVTPKSIWDGMSVTEQRKVNAYGNRYKKFLKEAVCAPWTARAIIQRAEKAGFRSIEEYGDHLKPGDKVYFNQDHQSVALAIIGDKGPMTAGLNIVGAHMDSPQLELKAQPVRERKGTVKLLTKPHGGGLWNTWMNRRVGIAGRVFVPVMDGDRQKMDHLTGRPMVEEVFIRTSGPVGSANLEAIHLNRTQNDGRAVNKELDLNPLVGLSGEDVVDILKQTEGVDLAMADRSELFLFPTDPPSDTGIDKSMIHAQGHDDRSMCYAALEAIIEASKSSNPPKTTSVAMFFDNEETGSLDRGGAQSRWVESVAGELTGRRVGGDYSVRARETALSKSFIFSADVSHAWDENHKQYHGAEGNNAVYMGLGPAIKSDTSGHYASTGQSQAMAIDLFKRAGIPYQVVTARQDIPCGTTIGPMIAANTSALTVDVGAAILSMHAIEEVASKVDLYLTKKAFSSFFKGV